MTETEDPKTAAELEMERAEYLAELVTVEALCLVSFDGNLHVEGMEYYAPKGWQPPEMFDGNGNPVPYLDGNGNEVTIAGTTFEASRGAVEAMIKAKAVRLVG